MLVTRALSIALLPALLLGETSPVSAQVQRPWDAVCGVAGSKNTYYFFQGDAFWRYRGGEVTGPSDLRKNWRIRGPVDAVCGVAGEGGKANKYYLFSGRVYYKYTDGEVTGPFSIEKDWGVDAPLDAICGVAGTKNKYYLFRGAQFWRWQDGKAEGPLSVEREWGLRIPVRVLGGRRVQRLDAVCAVAGDKNKYYLFVGDFYWKFEDRRLSRPQPMTDWKIR